MNERPVALVVDDDGIVRTVVERLLRETGFCTLQAACGEEALGLVLRTDVDLLVTDFEMPGIDGVELAQQAWRWQQMAVVIMSGARRDQIEAVNVLPAGAIFLSKPFQRSELLEAVGNARRHACRRAGGGDPAVHRGLPR